MKIHDAEQGTIEWFAARCGKVGASEMKNILTPKLKLRTGDMLTSFLYAKVAEAYRNAPLPGFTSWQTDQGNMREDEAIPWFELEHDCEIQSVGFIEHDNGRCGCSPDGLIGDDGGIEVKCPEPVNHLRYLLENELPEEYFVQVHTSLYVTGRKWWKFLSYRRGFPAFILHVERDEEIIKKIDEAITSFGCLFDTTLAKLKSFN